MSSADLGGDDVTDDDTAALEARLARYPADRYPAQHATAAFHLGTAHLQRGRLHRALGVLGAAYGIFGGLGMRLEQAKALTMHGVALRESGRSDLARHAFERALKAFDELDQPGEEAAASYNLGLVLREQDHSMAAQRAMAHAHERFLQAGHLAQAGTAAREQGALLLMSGEAGSALPLLDKAIDLAERSGDLPGLGAAANVLGLAHLASGNATSAVTAFSRAAAAFPRSMRPAELAMVKANLALAHEQGGNPAAARLAARQALSASSADPPVRAQAQQVLDRLSGATEPNRLSGERESDLFTVLEAEPHERWAATVREEVLQWCDLAAPARVEAVTGFVNGIIGRAGTSVDFAESLVAVLLELPPQPYANLVAAVVEATEALAEHDSDRVRAVLASAMARFPMPQWQRLVSSLNAAATAAGRPPGWR